MILRTLIIATVGAAISLSLAQDAAASDMFAMGRTPGSDDSTLLAVTPSPFSVTPIGTSNLARLSGIDFEPGTNTLFAVSNDKSTGVDSLFTVDVLTGAATLVGPIGSRRGDISDLAIDNDGNAFGTDFEFLYSIDLNTGAGTEVGALSHFGFLESIAVDPTTNILYGLDFDDLELWSIDKTTGELTSLGVFGGVPSSDATGFGIDSDGTFYASTGGGVGEIWRLEPNTFTKSLVGDAFDGSVSDIAFTSPVCDILTATDFASPMGKKKKLGATLPVKFQLFFDEVEIQGQDELDLVLAMNGCQPDCPHIGVLDVTDPANAVGLELPEDLNNVGEAGDLGDCFRFSNGNWIFNLQLPNDLFFSGRTYLVEVGLDGGVLNIGNDVFQIK